MDIDPGDGWDANGSPAEPVSRCNGNVARTCEWDGCANPLRGRQLRFCSEAHKNLWHDLYRPRIASPVVGHPRAGTIKALILGALQDGQWHSAHELAVAVKADTHSVKARLSELQRAGHPIVTDLKRGNVTRPHRYRLAGISE